MATMQITPAELDVNFSALLEKLSGMVQNLGSLSRPDTTGTRPPHMPREKESAYPLTF